VEDKHLVQVLQRLYAAEDKPQNLGPIDLALLTRTLLQHGEEDVLYVSQDTLATQLGCSPDTIGRATARLKDLGWLEVRSGGYQQRTNLYSVNVEKLPQAAALVKTIIGAEAKKLAWNYGSTLKINSRKKGVLKGWVLRWSFHVQRLLNQVGGDSHKVLAVINHCWNHPTNSDWRKRAQTGPHKLRRVWARAVADYDDVQAAKAAQAAQAAAQAGVAQ
jgi:biotin operon repressor